MKLLITEKYSQAEEFAKILDTKEKHTSFDKGTIGYLKGEDWLVTWCAGHLISAAMPDAYDNAYKAWNLTNLPFIPATWKFIPNPVGSRRKQIKVIDELFRTYTIEAVYHAGDPDREGELIVREILTYLGYDQIPLYRLWYQTTVASTLQKALQEAQPAAHYTALYEAADARQKADYLVGINLSRAYTAYAHNRCNVGRVISATINLIVEKQKEIDNFIPEDYTVLTATCRKAEQEFTAKARFDNNEEAITLAKTLKGTEGSVTAVEKKTEQTRRLLFDLTTLQAEASKRLGITGTEVADRCQTLYEKGWISYPRTNSNYINEDQVEETRPLLDQAYKEVFASPNHIDPQQFDITPIIHKKGEGAEASHTGLCPTAEGIAAYQRHIKSNSALRSIFLLITARLLCSCLPPKITDKTKAIIDLQGHPFTATGSVIKQEGFASFEKYVLTAVAAKKVKHSQENPLPPLQGGDMVEVLKVTSQKKKTSPPKAYTQDTLLLAMKNIASQLSGEQKAILKNQNAGLGTVASRHTIIDNMKKSDFVTVKGGYFHPTEKAFSLMTLLPEDVKSPVLTANMELDLDAIAQGKKTKEEFLNQIIAQVTEQVNQVKNLPPIPDTQRYADNKVFLAHSCPLCGADVVETDRFFVCRDNCGFILWRTIAKKKISKEECKHLLTVGHSSSKLDNFKSKAGKPFSCWLYLDDQGKIAFDFDDQGIKAHHNLLTSQS